MHQVWNPIHIISIDFFIPYYFLSIFVEKRCICFISPLFSHFFFCSFLSLIPSNFFSFSIFLSFSLSFIYVDSFDNKCSCGSDIIRNLSFYLSLFLFIFYMRIQLPQQKKLWRRNYKRICIFPFSVFLSLSLSLSVCLSLCTHCLCTNSLCTHSLCTHSLSAHILSMHTLFLLNSSSISPLLRAWHPC